MTNSIGQNWLLLRGLARESAHWGSFIEQLQLSFPNATINVLDLPGTGRFNNEASPKTIKEITEITRQKAIDNNYLQEPITLLAVSLGAMVAWEWMYQYSNEIRGSILINTSFANLSPFYQRLRWQTYHQVIKLLSQKDITRRERAIMELVSNTPDIANKIGHDWADIQHQHPISFSNAFRQIAAAANYRPSDTKPKPPVLLLNSKTDRLVSPTCSEKIQQKYQLELKRQDWAGHDLTLDDPEWVTRQLKDWVKNHNAN